MKLEKFKKYYENYKFQIDYKIYSEEMLNYIQSLDCWVVSPGGVGTTTFINYLNNYIKTNSVLDEDKLKHKKRPPRNIQKNLKIIFLTGNPKHIVNSLKNRQLGNNLSFYFIQFLKLESPFRFISTINKKESRFLKLIKKQELNWLSKNKSLNILRIDYENLFESAEEISKFLEIYTPEFIENFPKRKKRISYK